MSNNNLATELSLLALSLALLAAMTVLLVVGKITWIEAIPVLTIIAGLYGVNTAYKVPSPTQQAQISTQQESLQALVNLLATHTHPMPSTPTQPGPPAPSSDPALTATTPFLPNPAAAQTYTVPGALAETATVQPQVQFVPESSPIDPSVSMAAYSTSQMPVVTPPQVQP